MICIKRGINGAQNFLDRSGAIIGTLRLERIGRLENWLWRYLKPYDDFGAIVVASGSCKTADEAIDLVLFSHDEHSRLGSVANSLEAEPPGRREAMRA